MKDLRLGGVFFQRQGRQGAKYAKEEKSLVSFWRSLRLGELGVQVNLAATPKP